ncbi:hypothetical protein ACFQ0D_11515, partial [Micromonospora zhanjiangensis]
MNFTAITKTALTRKSVVAAAGLAFAGGVVAGPLATVTGGERPAMQPAAVTQTITQADKPSADKLMPNGTPSGKQSRIGLNDEQKANVKAIVAATKKAGMDERAAVISIATSLQESKLENLGHL